MSLNSLDCFVRRAIDLTASAVGLVVLLPLLATLAVLVKLADGGPIFYVAQRIGKNGAPLRIYKFRTMHVDSDRQSQAITVSGDRRITSVGRWLRRSKLDELPQLFNVLKGDMALVGPRPEDPCYVALYTDQQREILNHRPGITSPASLEFRHEERMLKGADWETAYTKEILPAKLATDLNYVSGRTVLSDIRLILRTFGAILSGNECGDRPRTRVKDQRRAA